MGLAALNVAQEAAAADAPPPQIRRYRSLGKTGLEISDIGFGSGGCRTADLVRHCYDRGINYFDTAEMYRTEGWSTGEYVEKLIGDALEDKRDKVVIASKYVAEVKHDRAHIMKQLEASLRRMRTDYVDIFLNHAVNEPERMSSPEWQEFVALAKKQGKIRFSGMSGHGGRLQECLDHVLDRDLADVILCSHNFGNDPAFYERFTKHFDMVANQKGISRLFAKARKKGVGVVVMKTQMGAKVNDLSVYQKDGADFARAAFRWVFSDPNIDAAIVSMRNKTVADNYISCSGDETFAARDHDILERYVAEMSNEYCRPGCDACTSSCPEGVPIPDVLRQRMYEERYGNPRMARQGYARLGAAASACSTCTDQACLGSCPYNLEIPKLTRATARRLATS
jgi:hypothetical protein